MEQVTEQPATETKPEIDSAEKQRAETELYGFIEKLGLAKCERQAVGTIAINVRNMANQVAGFMGVSPDDRHRLVSAGVAVALKTCQLADVACCCAQCVEKRVKRAGWRGRIRRAIAAFKAAWNA